MKKLQKLQKNLDNINAEISKISFERQDTSYRRKGGYYGTTKAITDDVIVVSCIARTAHLNTYVCVPLGNEQIMSDLNHVKAEIAEERLRLQKIANKKWENDSIAYCEKFVERQIQDGTIHTNYVKIFVVGNNNIYGAHPYFKHEDYNKFVAMPNTEKHRLVAKRLNEKIMAAGLKIAEPVF